MRFSWQVKLGLILVSISIAVYSIKFLLLKNPADTLNYVFNSLGFLPISAFLVTIILNELLTRRSRRERLEKLNMVIGAFFSQVGVRLLRELAAEPVQEPATVKESLTVAGEGSPDFASLDFSEGASITNLLPSLPSGSVNNKRVPQFLQVGAQGQTGMAKIRLLVNPTHPCPSQEGIFHNMRRAI